MHECMATRALESPWIRSPITILRAGHYCTVKIIHPSENSVLLEASQASITPIMKTDSKAPLALPGLVSPRQSPANADLSDSMMSPSLRSHVTM